MFKSDNIWHFYFVNDRKLLAFVWIDHKNKHWDHQTIGIKLKFQEVFPHYCPNITTLFSKYNDIFHCDSINRSRVGHQTESLHQTWKHGDPTIWFLHFFEHPNLPLTNSSYLDMEAFIARAAGEKPPAMGYIGCPCLQIQTDSRSHVLQSHAGSNRRACVCVCVFYSQPSERVCDLSHASRWDGVAGTVRGPRHTCSTGEIISLSVYFFSSRSWRALGNIYTKIKWCLCSEV